MDDSISRQDAIKAAIKADIENHNGILSEKRARVFEEHISILPPVQPKAYTKADYIMALHKEYGCTLTRAEEAHDKALEYLRSKAIVKG